MKIERVLSMLITLGLIGACKSTTNVVENTSSDTGTLQGNVALVDVKGDTLLNYSGITIQIQGTQFHTTSNSTGSWSLDNLPAGIYNIILTKPGFDTLIIPQYQFSGVGTSYLVNTGIQALPMDSLVFTVTNTTEDSSSINYLGLLSMSGSVSGPDSSVLVQGLMVASGGITQSPTVFLTNGKISNLDKGAIGYNEPPDTSGSIVTFRSYLYANASRKTVTFTHFQQATSPFIIVRTIKLP
jgi:hypothetical protein